MESQPKTERKGVLKSPKQAEVTQEQLDIAKQILQESFAQETQEEDPYTQMARKIEERKKGHASKKNLEEEKGPAKGASKKQVQEEVKKPIKKRNPISGDEDEQTDQSEVETPEEKARKLEEMAARIQANEEPIRQWTRRIKIAACLIFLIWTAFMNGAFTANSNAPAIVDREGYSNDLISMNHIYITLRESWFLFVAFAAYLGLKTYNDYLDREEQKLVQVAEQEEQQFVGDDTDSTVTDPVSSPHSGSEESTPRSSNAEQLAENLAADLNKGDQDVGISDFQKIDENDLAQSTLRDQATNRQLNETSTSEMNQTTEGALATESQEIVKKAKGPMKLQSKKGSKK